MGIWMHCVQTDEGRNLKILSAVEDLLYFPTTTTTVFERKLSHQGPALVLIDTREKKKLYRNFNQTPSEETCLVVEMRGFLQPFILITVHYSRVRVLWKLKRSLHMNITPIKY